MASDLMKVDNDRIDAILKSIDCRFRILYAFIVIQSGFLEKEDIKRETDLTYKAKLYFFVRIKHSPTYIE